MDWLIFGIPKGFTGTGVTYLLSLVTMKDILLLNFSFYLEWQLPRLQNTSNQYETSFTFYYIFIYFSRKLRMTISLSRLIYLLYPL